jgi:hypothetical protein
MRCKNFESMASAYVDQELSASEAQEYHSHLAVCAPCCEHLEELEMTSLFFKESRKPEVPRELHSYVMTAIERRVSGDISLQQRTVEWLLTLNPRPFSFATGAVVSIILFAFTLSGFKPLPASPEGLNSMAVLLAPPPDPVVSSGNQFNAYNDISANTSTADDEAYYELPRMLNSGSMVSFSHLAYQKPGNEGMSVMLEVETDGRAKLVNVLDDPNDPAVVEQLWWILGNPTFQPATVEGQPVSTRIILFVEKMDVGG